MGGGPPVDVALSVDDLFSVLRLPSSTAANETSKCPAFISNGQQPKSKTNTRTFHKVTAGT